MCAPRGRRPDRDGPGGLSDRALVGSLGVAGRDGCLLAEGIEPGDALLEIGDLKTTGATMGTVVDALRGSPGALRVLVLERGGEHVRVEARVAHVL